jgi:topoisomerase-4 subunit A
MMKRAPVTGITRDKQYNIAREHQHTKILYFSANPNGEAEVIKVYLRPRPRLKNPVFEFDFAELAIKGRDAQGNILTKFSVQKIVIKEKGVSTLGGRKIWFDEDVMRLNVDARGKFLGEFSGEDQILVITGSGHFRTTSFDLSNHFEDDVLIIEKYREGKIWSAAYFDAEQDYYYLKRFLIEPGAKLTRFIGDHPESKLIRITEVEYPRLELKFGGKNKDRNPEIIEVAEFIGIKSYKARGKRLSNYEVKVIQELTPLTQAEKPGEEVETPEAEAPEKEMARSSDIPKTETPKTETPKTETPKSRSEKTPPTSKKPEVAKQDPDDVPFEVVKPREETTGKEIKGKEKGDGKEDKRDPGGQFTLEW